MLDYLLKSGACMLAFLFFYKLVLEKAPIHQFKRYYLLGSIIASFLIPQLVFVEYISYTAPSNTLLDATNETPLALGGETPTDLDVVNWTLVGYGIYALGLCFFGYRFCTNLFQLYKRIQKNVKIKEQGIVKVLLQEKIPPHTFFKYIFLNKALYSSNGIPKEVVVHEETHAREYHSLDVFFLELMQLLFWFNPCLYFYKKSIQLNHEFLADQAVLNQGTATAQYQQILLAFSSNAKQPPLASAIHYSSIKKRFTVMKTKTSKTSLFLKTAILLPLLAALIYGFSETKIIPVAENPIEEVAITTTKDTQGKQPTQANLDTWKDVSSYAIWIDHVHVNNEILNNYKPSDFGNYALSFVYDNARSTSFPQPYQLNLYTKAEYQKMESQKNSTLSIQINKEGQILVDDIIKLVPLSDIKTVLETQVGKKNVLRAIIKVEENAPRHVVSEVSNSLNELKISQLNIVETKRSFRVSKSSTDQKQSPSPNQETAKAQITINGQIITERAELSKEDIARLVVSTNTGVQIKSFKIKIPGKPTYTVDGDFLDERAQTLLTEARTSDAVYLFDTKTAEEAVKGAIILKIIDEKSIEQEKATAAQLKEYNKLARRYNKMMEQGENVQIKMKDVTRLKYIYGIMSEQQKKTAEPFPDFPPPPPPPPAPEAPNVASVSGAVQIDGKTVYYNSKNGVTKYYNKYGVAVDADGNAITPETMEMHPDAPPPPPSPPNPLDMVISMAKKGASFFYNDEVISSDEAIDRVKKSKNLHISVQEINTNTPTVRLSSTPITVSTNH